MFNFFISVIIIALLRYQVHKIPRTLTLSYW